LRDHQHILLSDEVLNDVLNLLSGLNSAFNTSVAFCGAIFQLKFLDELVDDIRLHDGVLSFALHVLYDAGDHYGVLLVLIVGDLYLLVFLRFRNGLLNLSGGSLRSKRGSLGSSIFGLLIQGLKT
jgi:glycosyltransferase involved in cell wall biosynthesis